MKSENHMRYCKFCAKEIDLNKRLYHSESEKHKYKIGLVEYALKILHDEILSLAVLPTLKNMRKEMFNESRHTKITDTSGCIWILRNRNHCYSWLNTENESDWEVTYYDSYSDFDDSSDDEERLVSDNRELQKDISYLKKRLAKLEKILRRTSFGAIKLD